MPETTMTEVTAYSLDKDIYMLFDCYRQYLESNPDKQDSTIGFLQWLKKRTPPIELFSINVRKKEIHI